MSVYKVLEKLSGGVLYERAVERDLVRLLEHFAEDGKGEGLDGAEIHVSVKGVPLIMSKIDDGADALNAVRAKTSYIIVIASGYAEDDGAEHCSVRIVVATKLYDGKSEEQAQRHERWCTAVRGIMSKAAQMSGVLDLANNCAQEFSFCGWERDGQEVVDQWSGDQWIHEETFIIRGLLVL